MMYGVGNQGSDRMSLRVVAAALAINLCAGAPGASAESDQSPAGLAKGNETDRSSVLPSSPEFTLWLKHPNVVVLRRLLAESGYLSAPTQDPETFDLALLKIVRAFQSARGLKSTGMPRAQTIAALNGVTEAGHRESSGAAPLPESTPLIKHSPALDTQGLPSQGREALAGELPVIDAGSVQRMQGELARYVALQANTDIVPIPAFARAGRASKDGQEKIARAVELRLRAEGLLSREYSPTGEFNEALRSALRRWQQQHGLRATGSMNPRTRAKMNVPIAVWIRQLQASIKRVQEIQKSANGLFVLVNAADAKVQVMEGNVVRASVPVIVGRNGRKSPQFVSAITYIQPFPTWTVPQSIVRKDIAPKVYKNHAYLERNHMRAMIGQRIVDAGHVNWRRGPFPTIVQKPGTHNALGLMRFGMKSHGAYYLHGTSQPKLLMRPLSRRFVSSGCVRLADPFAIALILLQHSDPTWTAEKLRARVMNHDGGWDPGEQIQLKRSVPVIWTYLTAWTTADGTTHFRDDIYRRNKPIDVASSQNRLKT